jgi:16S rRNA (uracil1498-N3)-methyltransferase
MSMRAPRIFHPEPLMEGTAVVLESSAARHLLTVLRLEPGAHLTLFDGSGQEFEAELERIAGKQAWAMPLKARAGKTESPLNIALAQGISRGERMDYTVQKAVELGVTTILPLAMERSVVRLDAEKSERKREHWQSVVNSACEQSGRVRVPQVAAPQAFTAFLAAHRNTSGKLLLDAMADTALAKLPKPDQNGVLLLVGPEGGLSDTERRLAETAGFKGVRLGPRILRTETAALVALSLMQSLWGDLG